MNRLVDKLAELTAENKKAFVAYIMAGDPSIEATKKLIPVFEKAGVTALELGVPFSDPIADGPVIAEAAPRALRNGVTLRAIFDLVAEIRKTSYLPIVLMGYWNVFMQYGLNTTLEDAKSSGVDGFIIADLPPEHEPEFFSRAKEKELCTICLASEMTSDERMRSISQASTGFLYYVPQPGITGLDLAISAEIQQRIGKIKTTSRVPLLVGIGIKSRDDVRSLNKYADGVIVGTKIVQYIHEHSNADTLYSDVEQFVRGLMGS